MSFSLGVVMDPIRSIKPHKDSSFAMLLAAQARGWSLGYMETGDLFLRGGEALASVRSLEVWDRASDWYRLGDRQDMPVADFDIVLMRKDPPVDQDFVSSTYILDRAEAAGALVVNRPGALRDLNEKVVTARFPDCCPPSLFTGDADRLRAFVREHEKIVLKKVDGMGGRSVFFVRAGDPNTNVILEEMTMRGTRQIIAQAFVPDVLETGDKRILLIDGEPVPYAITRIPAPGDFRANIAVGAEARPVELDERDRELCSKIGPTLREEGIYFAGIDVIGGLLTEVNVTSPTCIREIDRFFDLNVAADLLDALERRL